MTDSHLTRTQIEVLARLADGKDEYIGMDGNEKRTIGSLIRRGLATRTAAGTLPRFAITSTGRDRLARCR